MKILVRCVISMMLIVFSLFQVTQGERPIRSENSTAGWRSQIGSRSRQSAPIPEHVIYGFFFSRTAAFQRKAAELSNSGVSSRVVRTSVENEANLDNGQILALADIALACAEQLRQQDARAGQIIAAFRARFPDRKIPPGVSLPPPPPELKLLQEERSAIILRARDRLREVFGEQTFSRFDESVKRRTSVKTQ